MSRQLIKCPNGTWGLWSDYADPGGTWVLWNMADEDYIEQCAADAAREARRVARHLLEDLKEGPRHVYAQFAVSFEKANAGSIRNGGPDLTTEEGQLSGKEVHAGEDQEG
jgi:hypothetical protein